MEQKPRVYREVIDEIVDACKNGQGQIGPRRVLNGVWNPNATAGFIEDQHEINLLLARLSGNDRRVIAGMLELAFSGGAFEALKAFEKFEIEPFVEGYEGSPYHDFLGRMQEWKWPE